VGAHPSEIFAGTWPFLQQPRNCFLDFEVFFNYVSLAEIAESLTPAPCYAVFAVLRVLCRYYAALRSALTSVCPSVCLLYGLL